MRRWVPLFLLISGCGSNGEPGLGTAAVHADIGGVVSESLGETHVVVSKMASGVIVQQVENGADYDLIIVGSKGFAARVSGGIERRTLAYGRLAIYGAKHTTLARLLSSDVRIATANPKTAPYGVAAMAAIDATSESKSRRAELIQFDDVRAAKLAVDNGAALVAIVSLTQAKLGPKKYVELGDAVGVESTAIAFTKAGQQILDLLTSSSAQKIWADAGLVPTKPR